MMKKLFLVFATPFLSNCAIAQYKLADHSSSEKYEAKINVENCIDGLCSGKATIILSDKITGKEIQTFRSNDLDFSLKTNQDPKTSTVELGKYQSPLIFGDFNFDGNEDIAIRNGSKSAYNDPSYDVYIFDGKNKFALDKELTTLASSNSGMFKIDRKSKQLSVYKKDGCCYNKTTNYRLDVKKGLLEVSSVIEDSSIGDYVTVITQKLVDGKTKRTIERFKTKEYYKEDN
ncbi:XAC2610-related protein [Pedobacter punctiformis]|uniref:VCBS repeat-containing protein n=1 Tax=Pedobacter punctiformis TaxID=3004097 RepID=A0ABT4LCH3_9SPHI|nr:hypothetical protein [Pedobacter sp. HCMS5-2]MCZ4245626.1 hypothetical protein [Pedobacter sp. HCMS5-2]